MQKSEKPPSFVGTLVKSFKKAVVPVVSILGITVAQDNISNTVTDSSLSSRDTFVMSDTTKDWSIPDTTKVTIADTSLVNDLAAQRTLKEVYGISLDKAAEIAKNIKKTRWSNTLEYVQHTLPKP